MIVSHKSLFKSFRTQSNCKANSISYYNTVSPVFLCIKKQSGLCNITSINANVFLDSLI